jgi:hypothetical protein
MTRLRFQPSSFMLRCDSLVMGFRWCCRVSVQFSNRSHVRQGSYGFYLLPDFMSPQCCRPPITGHARRQARRCSPLPQVPGNIAGPVMGNPVNHTTCHRRSWCEHVGKHYTKPARYQVAVFAFWRHLPRTRVPLAFRRKRHIVTNFPSYQCMMRVLRCFLIPDSHTLIRPRF